jgi:hypothetical protein
MEVAPENWIGVGGKLVDQLRRLHRTLSLHLCHGLSLSLGAPEPLDASSWPAARFLDQHEIAGYSDHLSYCSEHGHLYDLMPIPFTEEAVDWVAVAHRRRYRTARSPDRGGKHFLLRHLRRRDERAGLHKRRARARPIACCCSTSTTSMSTASTTATMPANSWPDCQPNGSPTSTWPAIITKPRT